MKNEELHAHKAKIKAVMVKHLEELGYPEMENEEIMAELKPMWIKIEEAGLIRPGMSFADFVAQAESAFMMEQVKRMIGI